MAPGWAASGALGTERKSTSMTRHRRLESIIRGATVLLGVIGTVWMIVVLFGASDPAVPTVLIGAAVVGAAATVSSTDHRGSRRGR